MQARHDDVQVEEGFYFVGISFVAEGIGMLWNAASTVQKEIHFSVLLLAIFCRDHKMNQSNIKKPRRM